MRRPLLLMTALWLGMLLVGALVVGSDDEPSDVQAHLQGREDHARAGLTHRTASLRANDYFANAQVLSGSNVSIGGTNSHATWQVGEPGSRGTTHSVWYRWKAPFSGTVALNTCNSSFDTVLAVNTGFRVSGLGTVAGDDDACDSPNPAGSRVNFNAVVGTTYRIAIRGFGGSEGMFTLNLILTEVTAPRINGASPANDVIGVARGTNVTVTFSEAMNAATIDGKTFELFEADSTRKVGAAVTYNAAAQKAVLNPDKTLQAGTRYKAVVTTGAADLAGNPLERDTAGNQQRVWFFTTRN